jgi:hypothetical protein
LSHPARFFGPSLIAVAGGQSQVELGALTRRKVLTRQAKQETKRLVTLALGEENLRLKQRLLKLCAVPFRRAVSVTRRHYRRANIQVILGEQVRQWHLQTRCQSL